MIHRSRVFVPTDSRPMYKKWMHRHKILLHQPNTPLGIQINPPPLDSFKKKNLQCHPPLVAHHSLSALQTLNAVHPTLPLPPTTTLFTASLLHHRATRLPPTPLSYALLIARRWWTPPPTPRPTHLLPFPSARETTAVCRVAHPHTLVIVWGITPALSPSGR